MRSCYRIVVVPVLVCMLAVMLAACQTAPYSNRSQLLLTTQSEENEQGAASWKEILNTEKISTDSAAVNALNRVGPRIASASEQKDFQWEFKVIESEQANAFCLPGGKVALYTGILPYMENDAEMAVVIGHEVSHAIARHGGERISQGYIQSFGSELVSSAFESAAAKEIAVAVYGVTTNLTAILPYSRLHESEADKIGMMLMAKAGYDPNYAISFWKKFGSSGGGVLEAFTSTHPLGSDRIKAMQENLPEALKIYNAAKNKYGAGEKLSFKASK